MSQWKFNDFETDVDFTDADFIERIEEAQELLRKDVSELPKAGKNSELIRAQNACYENFFDRIFGQGASAEMFRTASLSERLDAAESLKAFETRQEDSFRDRMNGYTVKHRGNRSQRREFEKNARNKGRGNR